ncbi:MAG: DUF5110 domain-containing protein [Prolixibacteraceae bacterium]|jgi:alpha-D-xyloside xylohydrolase|nr:DUF5110 domain-containing protein [Prolixibacteraceae bacterium]
MKNFWPLIIALFVLGSCNNNTYEETDSGIIVPVASNGEKVRLQVYDESVVQVTIAKPDEDFREEESLVVVAKPGHTDFTADETESHVSLSTASITARVNKKSGEIYFTDSQGNVLLKELEGGGRFYGKNVDETLPETMLQQVFESPADEAFYGLGQHQNGEVNYKGSDVELLQHNIVAVVPFVYSNKKYGLLWDNYSITRFGDPREYKPISSLKLYDADGVEGGLTATYYDKGDNVFVKIIEDEINYATLDEQDDYPKGYNMDHRSKVVWEGYFEPQRAGVHKFRLWAGGYSKLWVDGELLFDKWRQCWNPWYNKFEIDMKPGQKNHIKIEWGPDADVSYVGLTYLDANYSNKQEKLSLASETGGQIDYYFINGENADEIISGYRELTGKAPIVPKWAMGLWQSRERYKTQDELLEVVREYREREIPLDNIVLDWNYWPQDKWGDHDFDLERFPDVEAMTQEVHDMNASIMISVWPKFYVGTENYKWFEKEGWLFTKNVELGNLDWIGDGYLSTFYDPYNPDARDAFWEGLNEKLYSKGFDAWWLDATEPDIHSNVSLDERKSTLTPNHFGTGEEFFNAYSLLQAKGVYEGQRETDPDKRVYILTRSAFAGQQRYGAVTWSGDIVSRWGDLRDQWAAGINMGLSGIPYWTTDIGGFAVEKRYENQDPAHIAEWRELNTRWFQFGAFCPIFRIHGQFPYREIWNIAPEGTPEYESMVYYTNLRYRMMPYIYSLAGHAYHQNATIQRGLVMDFGNDPKVNNIDDQFMFGKAFMACPVGEFKQRNREVYLPASNGWYDFYTGKYFEGGNRIIANAPIGRMPLYVKAGSIVPFGPQIQYTTQATDGTLKVMVYTGANGSFELYEDEATNYDYENGEFATIPFAYNQEKGVLTIGQRNGKFDGMIKERNIEVYFVEKDKAAAFNLEAQPTQVVNYNGNEVKVEK